jgi:hypothetical protein
VLRGVECRKANSLKLNINLKQKHMTSIIFWAAIAITHVVNARIWRVEPTSFWYKSSWFFIGFSIACLMYFIGEYVSH